MAYGPKPKPPEELRTSVLQIRLLPGERLEIDDWARDLGVSISALARGALLSRARRHAKKREKEAP